VELTEAEPMKNIVVLTDDRMEEAAQARTHLLGLGYRVETVPREIRLWDEAALRQWAEPLAEDLLGAIHPAPPRILGSIEAVREDEWARAADEGPMAAWCATKVFCGLMKDNGGGSMIYLNSVHAEKPVGFGALFSMGCGATQMLAREAAQDYGEYGVGVYFIQKGVTVADPDSKSPVSGFYFGTDLRCAGRKLPEADCLNELIAFLLTPGAMPLTGSDLRADDAMTLFYTHRRKIEGRTYYEIEV
jgi:NAD(P)-dependent dehydrogenase (short-subunit alcohol dehydrogenase family)